MESQPPVITPLDLAWERINALGGSPTNDIEEAQNDAIGAALKIIEDLGGSDPLVKRAQGAQS